MRHLIIPLSGVILVLLSAAVPARTPNSAAPGRAQAKTRPAPPAAPLPRPKAARPAEATDPLQCATADCHAAVKEARFVHGPVNVNTCEACHAYADAKAHTFKLVREKADLCTFCHEFQTHGLPVVHKPVTKGDCAGCHDPHGSANEAMIRGKDTAEMCGRCHESVSAGRKVLHGPVAASSCGLCHEPHAAPLAKLVNHSGQDLCLSCHLDFRTALGAAKHTHKALEKGCVHCHDVHGSDLAMQMRKPVPELCTDCHEQLRKDLGQAKYKHSVVMSDKACRNCHAPHGSDREHLMAMDQVKACMHCHDKSTKGGDGRVFASLAEVNDVKAYRHGPIRDGHCDGCHSAHTAETSLRLLKHYSNAFYQGFAPENYELCFSCHDKALAEQEHTAKATGFRDGDRNLHFAHVNKEDRGRNCRVCHNTHTGRNERRIRDTVLYGKWSMPIKFGKTETGGSCAPGCHKAYEYDREKPVLPAKAATTRPAASGPATRPGRAGPPPRVGPSPPRPGPKRGR